MNRHLAYRAGGWILLLGLLLFSLVPVWGQGEETATVISPEASLRAEPSMQAEVTATLTQGALLRVLGWDDSREWMQVETLDGVVGWVSVFDVHFNGPYLPPERGPIFTAVDGRADDWARFTGPFVDVAGDSTGTVDLTAVRSYMNDAYFYMLIEVSGDPYNVGLVLIDLVTNTAGEYRTYQYALPRRGAGTLFVITERAGEARSAADVIEDRDIAIEFRMPLELLDSPDSLNVVSVQLQEVVDGILTTTDDLVEVMPAVVTLETEPIANATVSEERVNLRAAPVNGRIVRVLVAGEALAALGRNTEGDWLFVRLPDAQQGWVSSQYILADLDLDLLPVVEP